MICPFCKGNVVRKKIKYEFLGEILGIFPVDVCIKCKENFYTKETSMLIENIAKKKGLWNLKSKTKISKVGNSLAIRFNKSLINFLKLEKGQEFSVFPESKDKVVISRNK